MSDGSPIAAVLIHVPAVAEGLDWYERALVGARRHRVAEPWNFEYLDCAGVMLELVPADHKVTHAPAGSVVYWKVSDFEASLEHLLSVGASLYRGPLDIEGNLRMAQVLDPWGNCIGIRGPGRDREESRE